MTSVDPIVSLEHDHVHLSKLVAEVRRLLVGEPVDPEQLQGALTALRDDLFDHFGREEESLFPYLRSVLPELAPSLAELESAHDKICGGVTRMLAALHGGGPRPAAVFARFDAEYGDHARRESELLRGLDARLDPAQRAAVAAMLREG
ncbi:MAG: hemerythrin domain-containing protein [Myxococcales bacterium]|nr:hemerythrin domain-containing protein [Myxococcales bacterium]